jgi:hypothetical protein
MVCAISLVRMVAGPGKKSPDASGEGDEGADAGVREQPGDDDPHDTGYNPLKPDDPPDSNEPEPPPD